MRSSIPRNVLVVAGLLVAGLVTIPFFFRGNGAGNGNGETLPMGLLLEPGSGGLVVLDSLEEASDYGVKVGDVIQAIDEQDVASVEGLRSIIREKSSGDTIQITVNRGDTTAIMNRRYGGQLEYSVPASFIANRPRVPNPEDASVKVSHVGNSKTRMINRRWADFGLQLKAEDQRLKVVSVAPHTACKAYGVMPGDVLFQIDDQQLTTLDDFYRVSGDKFSGDRASLMLVRGEDIVLIQNMVLGATGEGITAPDDFVATVHPFTSLKKEALERLLSSPFDFESSNGILQPVDASTSLEPLVNTLTMNAATNVAEAPAFGRDNIDTDDAFSDIAEFGDVDPPVESMVRDAIETAREFEGETSDASEIADFARNVSDELGITRITEESPKISKPNARPRFDLTRPSRLPDIASEQDVAQEIVQEVAQTVDQAQEDIATILDGSSNALGSNGELVNKYIRDNGESLSGQSEIAPQEQNAPTPIENEWASSRRPRRATDYMAEPNPIRVMVPGSTLEVAQESSSDVLENQINAEANPVPNGGDAAVTNVPVANVDAPVQQSGQIATSELQHAGAPIEQVPLAGATIAHSNQQIPLPAPAPQMGRGYQDHNFGPSFGNMNASSGCDLGQKPNLSVQPECTQCGDWGCSSCRFKSHGGCSINKLLYGNAEPTVSVGGWFQAGYHSESNGLFNNRPDNLNLHQGWLYAEKAATSESPIGFRADIMYGIDGTDTQAFGNDTGEWDFDNGFDFGAYSWAIPQLYAEIAINDWTIKAGHFFTLVGYEVVTAPDNFFYSHAITMYNTEPFTHTGILASRSISDKLEIYAGWTLGWDTGFDQFEDGSSWLGGFSFSPMDEISFTYISTAGNFGARGDDAYSHSMVLDLTLSKSLNYVVQSDLLRVAGTGEDNVGINQYLLYSVNDQLGLGARLEWWKGDVLTGYAPHGGVLPADGSLSYYAATFGVNYRPMANFVARPEVRYDWSPAADYDEVYFGIDAIFSF